MGKQNPFQLDVVSVRLVRDAPIFSEQKIVNPESAIAVVGELLCEICLLYTSDAADEL